MKLWHLLLFATLTAHAQSATLRQYSRDWLISGETSLHKEPRRITAKSVFIAPNFSAVRCAQGYREDGNGNCVKLVRVSQTAQLDFLLQKLNAMYGSEGTAGSLPFGEVKPVAPYDPPKRESSPFGGTPGKGDDVNHENVMPPKAEPCIELPVAENTSTVTTTDTTPSTTLTTTSLSSTETLGPSTVVQIVATTTETPVSADVTLAVTTEGGLKKDPEVVLMGNESDVVLSVVKGNGTGVVGDVQIPVLDRNEGMGAVQNASGDHLLIEANHQAVRGTGDDGSLTSSNKLHEVVSTTEVPVPETVQVTTLDKDLVVDVADESVTTELPESTTTVDEVEDTGTEDYGDEFPIEPEMGSGERDKVDVENISEDNLFSETVNANLDAMLELNYSAQVDKVLPVRNIIPEASSERVQFVDSPITNIQPVRNTFPGDDEIMEVDLKPNANVNGASLQVHNLNPSKLIPPKFMEEPVKPIPDTPFSLDDYRDRQPVPPIPVYRPYENLNFNPQQQHFPLHYQQPPLPPRNGFVRFPDEREQVYHVDQRVNSVRFPPGEPFNDDKLRQWPNNWRLDNRRVQRPVMRFWNKMPLIRNPEEVNQRYQQDRRRPPPQYYQ